MNASVRIEFAEMLSDSHGEGMCAADSKENGGEVSDFLGEVGCGRRGLQE